MKRVYDLTLFFLFLLISIIFWILLAIFFLPATFLFGRRIYQKIADKLHKKTVFWQRKEIIERINKGSKVLDVGSGNGYLAKAIAEKREAKVTCADVVNHHKTDLPFKLFDGTHLPFKDAVFNFVILSYVLHHCQAQESLLKECARVCRGKILVLEDEPLLAKSLFAKAHKFVYNFLYNLNGKVIYYSSWDWRRIFKRCGLKVVKEEPKWKEEAFLIPMKRSLFVLRPRS